MSAENSVHEQLLDLHAQLEAERAMQRVLLLAIFRAMPLATKQQVQADFARAARERVDGMLFYKFEDRDFAFNKASADVLRLHLDEEIAKEADAAKA